MDPQLLSVPLQLQSRCTLTSRIVTLDERDGLRTHIIEAFPSAANDPASLPLIVLLHGFPELAYSWRKVLAPLSVAHHGYHVVAPDLRGYGRTVARDSDPAKQIQYDDAMAPFHVLNIVQDVHALVKALGHDSVSLIVGHDFGSIVAGHCVTAHPHLFRSVVFMSAPFTGVEQPPPHSGVSADAEKPLFLVAQAASAALAALTPPRKHYTAFYATRGANSDLLCNSAEHLFTFFGGYYHMKSGAWPGNAAARPLPAASAPSPTIDAITRDLATLPEYYVMPADQTMRQVVERHQRGDAQCAWPAEDAGAGRVFASEFARTGFQGGLNYYRSALAPPPAALVGQLAELAERTARTPAAFVSGARDWGVYQLPGAFERMRLRFGMQDDDVVLIEGAGHWVQQEAPDQVVAALVRFLDKVSKGT